MSWYQMHRLVYDWVRAGEINSADGGDGRAGFDISRYELTDDEDPLDYVAGFTVVNDLSERTFQLEESGGQWSKGKCLPGSTPIGPWLVTTDDVDHRALRLRSWVNDEPRQDSSTADLIFDCPTIIRHLSQYLALEVGESLVFSPNSWVHGGEVSGGGQVVEPRRLESGVMWMKTRKRDGEDSGKTVSVV